MFLSVLLVAFLSTAFNSPGKKAIDKDVGYSLTINQIQTVNFEVPAIQPVSILLDRGVSVPDKGLNFETLYFINENQISRFVCRIDNYSQTWQRSVNTTYKLVSNKGVNQYSQGVFRLDIGETLLS